mmetsp:Transcript_21981/g.58195  ORF Transcript_21981/g.58195 Transcript_21981/m.58195 type:complete len:115 (+) Transcript_21981:214-558(+)
MVFPHSMLGLESEAGTTEHTVPSRWSTHTLEGDTLSSHSATGPVSDSVPPLSLLAEEFRDNEQDGSSPESGSRLNSVEMLASRSMTSSDELGADVTEELLEDCSVSKNNAFLNP